MKSYVVVGLGRFGSEVARQLCRCGCEVLAIDIRSELVQQISPDVTHAAVADSRDKEVLRMLCVDRVYFHQCGVRVYAFSAGVCRGSNRVGLRQRGLCLFYTGGESVSPHF